MLRWPDSRYRFYFREHTYDSMPTTDIRPENTQVVVNVLGRRRRYPSFVWPDLYPHRDRHGTNRLASCLPPSQSWSHWREPPSPKSPFLPLHNTRRWRQRQWLTQSPPAGPQEQQVGAEDTIATYSYSSKSALFASFQASRRSSPAPAASIQASACDVYEAPWSTVSASRPALVAFGPPAYGCQLS